MTAERALRLASVVPAVLLGSWLLVGLPLLLVDALQPASTIALAGVLAAPLVFVVARLQPQSPPEPTAHWFAAVVAIVAVAAGFGALALVTSGEDVIVRRDPAVYAQTADWLADHGRLPIPTESQAFGEAPGLTYGSPGFFERGEPPSISPQFMSGTPIALTPAGWAGGLTGTTRGNAVIATLALLAVAGLAARLAGPWAAALTAVTLAFVFPELHSARAAYSEPAAQLLLFGGLALLVDAQRSASGRTRLAAHGLAGLLLGLGVLVRIDALVELVPLVPVIGVMVAAGRRRDALALGGGLALGAGLGLVDGWALSRPYLDMLSGELAAIAGGVGLVAVATGLVVRYRDRIHPRRWWPDAAAGLVVVGALLAYIVRPLLPKQTFAADEPVASQIADLESRLGLSPQGRTYVEDSMHWLSWWLGATGLALAIVGLALLLRRVLRNREDPALSFVLVTLVTTAALVARPGITPDHPWADRRFVPVVLPGLVLAASWLVVRAAQLARTRSPRMQAVVATVGAAALLVPTVVASAPLLGRRPYRGEIKAVHALCASLPADAAVVIVGLRARDELPQVIRGQCEVPVAVAPLTDTADSVRTAAAAVRANGRVPVVVGQTREEVAGATGRQPSRAVLLRTTEDDRQLVHRPTHPRGVTFEFWSVEPA